MTRNVPDMERHKLSAEIALLESVDVDQLRARWKDPLRNRSADAFQP
jgi:hypothetical protein